MPSRSIYVVANGKVSCLFMAGNTPSFVCTTSSFSIPACICGWKLGLLFLPRERGFRSSFTLPVRADASGFPCVSQCSAWTVVLVIKRWSHSERTLLGPAHARSKVGGYE